MAGCEGIYQAVDACQLPSCTVQTLRALLKMGSSRMSTGLQSKLFMPDI